MKILSVIIIKIISVHEREKCLNFQLLSAREFSITVGVIGLNITRFLFYNFGIRNDKNVKIAISYFIQSFNAK